MDNPPCTKLFLSYCHADIQAKDEFIKHTGPLRSNGKIEIWDDCHLLIGDNIEKEIDRQLREYDLIVFLVSSDFLDSHSCVIKELNYALERMSLDQSRIFPVIIKPCDWGETELKDYKCAPTDGTPITGYPQEDSAWLEVTNELKRVVGKITQPNLSLPTRATPSKKSSSKELTSNFSSFLEDTEVAFQHSLVEAISLADIYVYPELKLLTSDIDKDGGTICAKELATLADSQKSLILGQEQSGKSALAKKLFREMHLNKIPVYISASKIKRCDFADWLPTALKDQYEILDLEHLIGSDKQRILIIDDFTDIGLNKKHQEKMFDLLEGVFDSFIIISNKALKNSEWVYRIFGNYDHYEILSFGHLLRSKLIAKWISIGREETIEENLLLSKIDEYRRHIDSMLSRNIVPPKPIFILLMIQSLEVFRPTDHQLTSYGHCYHYLIQQSLFKSKIPANEIDMYINYLSELAYFIYSEGKNKIGLDDMNAFKSNYSKDYVMTRTHDQIVRALQRSNILVIENNHLTFGYKYIFYFYVAKYIADNLNNTLIKDNIAKLCESLHFEKNANILIFITHHSRDPAVIDEIHLYASTIFDGFPLAELGISNVAQITKYINEIPSLLVEERNVDEERKKKLQDADTLEASQPEDFQESNEAEDANKTLTEIIRSAKAIEIIGQILRNRYGSMKREDLIDLAQEAYSVGLRFLSFYLQLTEEINEMVTDHIRRIKHSNDRTKQDEILKKANKFFLSVCYGISLAVVRKIAISVGTDKLLDVFQEIEETNSSPAARLINLAITLEFKKTIPREKLVDMYRDLSSNLLCKRMIQEIVLQHMYMHHTTLDEKQWISDKLEIPMATQRRVDRDSSRKIEAPKNKSHSKAH